MTPDDTARLAEALRRSIGGGAKSRAVLAALAPVVDAIAAERAAIELNAWAAATPAQIFDRAAALRKEAGL